MRTVLVDPPAEIESWLTRRRELGQDRFDEVWQGEYHVSPAPHRRHADLDDQVAALLRPLARAVDLWPAGPINVGDTLDYRIPDRSYIRGREMTAWVTTVAIAVEILSTGDETWAKLDFYFAHGVEELLIIDPESRTVQWFARGSSGFETRPGSTLLGLSDQQLDADLDWPPAG